MANKRERFTNYSTMTRTYTTNEGSKKEKPFVVIEGNLVKDPELKAGKSTNYVFNSIGTSVSAEEVCARAKNIYDKSETYDDNNFFSVKFFGRLAERIAKIGKKGQKLIIWGDITEEEYKDASGNVKKNIEIKVENFIVIFSNQNNNSTKTKKAKTKKEAENKNEPEVEQEEDVDDIELSDDFLEDDDDLPF